MVNEGMDKPRCRACEEIIGQREGAFVYCGFLRLEVWGDSIQCPHGELLQEIF